MQYLVTKFSNDQLITAKHLVSIIIFQYMEWQRVIFIILKFNIFS